MKQLPGTTLEAQFNQSEQIFGSLFSAGGLVLSQVCTITGLDTHMVQNWIKRKFVAPPKNKKYSKDQLCRIITINLLKDVLPIDVICSLISHINGDLSDETDDLITDSQLYFYLLKLIELCENQIDNPKSNLEILLKNYDEPIKGAKKKLFEVLEIMFTAYLSTEYRKKTLLLFKIAEI